MLSTPDVLEFTTLVGERGQTSFTLTQAEADAMIALGFVFAVYDKRENVFKLDPPYAMGGDASKGTWTFRQARRYT